MSLGLKTESSGGGDFLPRIQYDARAGRFFRVDRVQTSAGWESNLEEIALPKIGRASCRERVCQYV